MTVRKKREIFLELEGKLRILQKELVSVDDLLNAPEGTVFVTRDNKVGQIGDGTIGLALEDTISLEEHAKNFIEDHGPLRIINDEVDSTDF